MTTENKIENRNKIVKKIGLKTSENGKNKEELIANLKGIPNEQIGLFKIFESSSNEIVIGEDDKHLNFRVSLFLDSSTTHQKLKNIKNKLYQNKLPFLNN